MLSALSTLSLQLEDQNLDINTQLEYTKENNVDLHINFIDLPSKMFAKLFPNQLWLQTFDIKTTGNFHFSLPEQGMFDIKNVTINSASGAIEKPYGFDQPLNLASATMKGHTENQLSNWIISESDININRARFQLSSNINFDQYNFKEANTNTTVQNVQVKDLPTLWPSILAPKSRAWVIKHILSGKIPSFTSSLKVTSDDIKNRKLHQNALTAKVSVQDALIQYSLKLPAVKHATGSIHFTESQLNADITHGTVENSEIIQAKLQIEDFNAPNRFVHIQGTTIGPAQDATVFFNPDKTNQALKTDVKNIKGKAKTLIDISVPLIEKVLYKNINIKTNTHIIGAELPKLLEQYNLTKGNLQLIFDKKKLNIKGMGLINNVPVSAFIAKDLIRKNNSYYKFRARLSKEQRQQLALPIFSNISDKPDVFLSLKESEKGFDFIASSDATQSDITIDTLGWIKPKGNKTHIKAKGEIVTKTNNIIVDELTIKGKNISAKGKAIFNKNQNKLHMLNLPNISFGNSKFSLHYDARKKQKTIAVKGPHLDISNSKFSSLLKTAPKDEQPSIITLDFQSITAKNNETLNNLHATLRCNHQCRSIEANASFNDQSSLTLNITPETDLADVIAIETTNAGKLLRGLAIHEQLYGGNLTLYGNRIYQQDMQTSHIEATLKIKDSILKKTKFLSEVASTETFKELQELSKDKGTKFKTIRVPFSFKDKILFIKDAKAHGDAIGFTAKGSMNTETSTMDIGGTIVPSYALNNFLAKIPIVGPVGEALMGGKGQGIIAVRFKAKGDYHDPKITLNPLSILTPGFLRNFFDIFDAPPKDAPPKNPASKG